MGFFANTPNDDQRVDSMGAMNPITELTPDGAFSGSWQALYKGVTGGAAAIGRTADAASQLNFPGNPLAPVGQAMDQFDLHEPVNESLEKVQDWAKTDPRVQGAGAQMIGATAHGATVFGLGSLAGGPIAGAATLGGTEGYNDYADSIKAGVDPVTAAEKAGLTAATSALGAFLPMKFGAGGASGLIKSMAGAATVNTGFGAANRWLTSELLDHAGYPAMAKQFAPLDAQAMAADAVMGLVFGGVAHLTHAEASPAERPTPDVVQQALDARRNEMVNRGAAGLPVDPVHANLDASLQDTALGNMLRGKPTDVAPADADAIVQHSLIDPERVTLNDAYERAGIAVHGDMADFSEPPRLTDVVEPFKPAETNESPPKAGSSPPADEGSTVNPIAAEQLRQLAERHADLDVETPSGRTVKAADLPAALKEDMANTTKESKLHDVAVACFLRTL